MAVPERRPAGETISLSDVLDVRKLYRHRFSVDVVQTKKRVWEVVTRHFFQHWIRADETVLDLGCGYGEFLNNITAKERIGVDFNPDSAEHLSPEITFQQGDVTNLSFLPSASVDTVFTSNMLEHLDSKKHVERLLEEAYRVLRPGGQVIAMGPNMRYLSGRYWDFWDHSVAITDKSLVEVMEYLDFEIASAYPKFLPYTTQSSLPQTPALVRMYLAFPPAWAVLGKQFLIRARKR